MKGQRLSVNTTVKVKVPVESNQAINKPKPTQNNVAVVDSSAKDSSLKTANVEDKTDSTAVAKVTPTIKVKQPKYVYHLVQPGDTLWNIAKRYNGVTIEMIKNINNLRSSELKVGTKLKVLVSG
jgi:membrane-bound lytic murein transglycosylase D